MILNGFPVQFGNTQFQVDLEFALYLPMSLTMFSAANQTIT